MTKTLSVLVPALDEAATIGLLLDRVLAFRAERWQIEVVVCDDGSTDETARIVADRARGDRRLQLVRHSRRRGKGAAVRSALERAAGDVVLVQDADLEYEVDDWHALLDAIDGGAEVVYGSRFLEARRPTGMALANFLGNRLLTAVANALFDLRITDQATCYKLARTDRLRELGLTAEGFELCSEITAKLGVRGIAIAEVPIRYRARSAAEGKKVRWTDAAIAIAVMLGAWWRGPQPARLRALREGDTSTYPSSCDSMR